MIKNFAHETGQLALKTMPYGGIYLVGGVTNGISKLIIEDELFVNTFIDKGRLTDEMKKFPIFLVNSKIELGLAGATERARREIKDL